MLIFHSTYRVFLLFIFFLLLSFESRSPVAQADLELSDLELPPPPALPSELGRLATTLFL